MKYFVEKGVDVKCRRGLIKSGKPITAADVGGQAIMDKLVEHKKVLASLISPFLSPKERAAEQIRLDAEAPKPEKKTKIKK